jgi:large subunit ribosomal protein L6
MSRIGKKVIPLPAGVKISNNGTLLTIEGPKGKLNHDINNIFEYKVEGNIFSLISRLNVEKDKKAKALYGMERAIINNKVNGVVGGFTKVLILKGVGYRAQMQGTKINLAMGFSHPVIFEIPAGIKAEVLENQTKIVITGIDKQLVGAVAAKIKVIRPPEPYKGKGIMYEGEKIRRKAGKSAAGAKGGK